PDPASRFQPEGPHGPSQIVNPLLYSWKDEAWKGVRLEGQVIYEMHIGTFTREGSWEAARDFLPDLVDNEITLLEIMPVAEFSESYFTNRYLNEWGEAINFDGPDSEPVREFFVSNAAYWIEEFHLDGLRLDATQQIFDDSPENVLVAVNRAARRAAGIRSIVMIAENETQNPRVAMPVEEGGYGMDAIWNDDFHHSAQVAVTGGTEAYYSDYCGTPQELVSVAKWGFLYQGQYSIWQRKRRGQVAFDLKAAAKVDYIQNHDQIAN